MSKASCSNAYYFLTISILPQKEGLDVVNIIRKISDLLVDCPSATKIIHKFKISAEARMIAMVEVSDIAGLERILLSIWKLGPVEIDSQPIILYETFAKNMKIANDLCKPSSCSLAKEGIYWLEFNIEYHGRTFDEFLEIWKKEAETVLTRRSKGEASLELFKCLAQRKVHVMFNTTDPAQLDLLSFQLPIMVENGVNIRVKSKGVQYLDDYVQSMRSVKL
ncbi:unnamed protein product [Candidula unifasciata]|uniref:Uncharacterized protein n=1 Tax=Candidula unifasciata TaxID=100452 RepID=A0A8S3ZJD7_9EUPU|nr:unnamed protein product [Candidula unifasciata]